MKRERDLGIDILKVMAVLFVIILHLDNIYATGHGYDLMNNSTKFCNQFLETLAYPAVNIFVLSGSYLMCGRVTNKLSNVLKIYISTWIITMVGLVVCLIFMLKPSGADLLRVLFPFSFRAYGYVSSYLILIIASPFMNILLKQLSNIETYLITMIFVMVVIFFPTIIPFINWGENYTELFFCLFWVAASIKRMNSAYSEHTKKLKIIGLAIWFSSLFLMNIFPFVIDYLATIIPAVISYRDFCFNYHNILVVLEAIGLLIFFTNVRLKLDNKNIFSIIITNVSKTSLVIYMYHMHPVVKRYYYDIPHLKTLEFSNGFGYLMFVMTTVLIIVSCGLALGKCVSFITDSLTCRILIIVKRSKFVFILNALRIECK